MIVKTQGGWDWGGMDGDGFVSEAQVTDGMKARVSALLGPDGEPLLVAYEKHPLGFRLTKS